MSARRLSRWVRLALAVTIAPIAAGFLAAAIYVPTTSLHLRTPPMGGWGATPIWILTVGAYVALLSLLVTLTVGLLTHALLRARRFTQVGHYVSTGATAGTVIGVSMLALRIDPGAVFLLGTLTGALTGWFAWLIRRPDRDAPANPASTAP